MTTPPKDAIATCTDCGRGYWVRPTGLPERYLCQSCLVRFGLCAKGHPHCTRIADTPSFEIAGARKRCADHATDQETYERQRQAVVAKYGKRAWS